MRSGRLYLQCVDDAECRIVTVPASFTDFGSRFDETPLNSSMKTYFTVKSLSEANSILRNALKNVH